MEKKEKYQRKKNLRCDDPYVIFLHSFSDTKCSNCFCVEGHGQIIQLLHNWSLNIHVVNTFTLSCLYRSINPPNNKYSALIALDLVSMVSLTVSVEISYTLW